MHWGRGKKDPAPGCDTLRGPRGEGQEASLLWAWNRENQQVPGAESREEGGETGNPYLRGRQLAGFPTAWPKSLVKEGVKKACGEQNPFNTIIRFLSGSRH